MSAPDRKLDQLVQICRRHGLPVTIQRRAILAALSVRKDHPTADQVFHAAKKRIPEVSRTTVYRVLDAFVRIGIARLVCNPGAAARYEAETDRHHHLVCMRCEKMSDLQDSSLDSLPLPGAKSGFHIEDYSIQFRGLCSACAAKISIGRVRPTLPAPKTKSSAKRRRLPAN